MNATGPMSNHGLAVDDVVEVKVSWDEPRGWLQVGSTVTLKTPKANGEWIGVETGSGRTVTIPKDTKHYVEKV